MSALYTYINMYAEYYLMITSHHFNIFLTKNGKHNLYQARQLMQ